MTNEIKFVKEDKAVYQRRQSELSARVAASISKVFGQQNSTNIVNLAVYSGSHVSYFAL